MALSKLTGSSSKYEPLPRFYHISSRVGSKVVVQGGRTKDFSEKSRQHLSSVVEIFDPYSSRGSKDQSQETLHRLERIVQPVHHSMTTSSRLGDMMAVNTSTLSADWTQRSCAGVKCLLRMQTELPCPRLRVEL